MRYPFIFHFLALPPIDQEILCSNLEFASELSSVKSRQQQDTRHEKTKQWCKTTELTAQSREARFF